MKYIFTLLFFLSSLTAFSLDISDSTITNGRTALIVFDKEKDIEYDSLIVDKSHYSVFNHPSQSERMYVLFPVSYYEKPSTKKVELVYTKSDKKLSKFLFFKIEDGKYQQEKIEVQKSKVNPKSEAVKNRITKEYAEAMKIYNTITPKNYVNSKYIVPMQSKITSSFGKARVYNSTLNGYHSGTDFRAKIGTPIVASNTGKVVLAQDRFYSGNSIILDHGQGIYTCYYHLNEFKVKKGDIVIVDRTSAFNLTTKGFGDFILVDEIEFLKRDISTAERIESLELENAKLKNELADALKLLAEEE